jgi:glycerophosphoryl diester phosphodiesterase
VTVPPTARDDERDRRDEVDEARDDHQEWWVRRAVLSALAVLGVVTVVFAIVSVVTGTPPEDDDPDEADTGEAVTNYVPTMVESDGPLRLGELLVVGRHGSPVERPAHTLASYELAIAGGAGYVEVQVAVTSDEQLVVRPDVELSGSTDVAERSEYADRETTRTVDGESVTGWFTDQFTLAELEELRATEPEPELRPDVAESYGGDLPLVSFDDLLARVGELSAEEGREVGIIVEPLEPAYFRSVRRPIERAVARSLRKARLLNEPELVTIASPDTDVLERFEGNLGDNVLSALVVAGDETDRLSVEALEALPGTIDAVLVDADVFGAFSDDPASLPARVHDAGLAIGVFPISVENARLAPGFRRGDDPAALGNIRDQVRGLRQIGVDLVLTEAPAAVVEVVTEAAAEDAASPSDDAS